MAQNYSIIQIVGIYGPSYEALFGQVNPSGLERVNAAEAASFMKRSGLSDLLLAKVWDMSDWDSRGSLDKHGWFVAMKLIALAQAGKDVSVGNLQLDVPPARFSNPDPGPASGPPISSAPSQRRGSATITAPASAALPTAGAMYPTLSGEDRFKFERMFEAQQPAAFQPGGKLVLLGDRVRMLLAATNLPNEILASLWNLSDLDRDGALDRDEFVILMHLVHRTMEGVTLPQSIPPHLIPQSKQVLASASEPRRVEPSSVVAAGVNSSWAVPEADRAKFETMFRAIDTDSDGMVNGADCRDLLLRSGLAQPILAQIWGLCDVGNTGKLTSEQFTLAMYLVQRKMLGQEVPAVLPPELVPPSMRAAAVGAQLLPAGGTLMIGSVSISDPKLLEFKEIQELKAQFDRLRAERAAIEKQRTQEDSGIRLQQNELSLLQREFESVTTTVRQLELQKGEAQKRLDELAERTRRLRASATETREHAEAERRECDSLRNSVGSQSNNRREREEEISALRSQLNAVTQEEHALNDRLSAAHSECDRLARAIRETVANTDRVRQTISKYEEQKTQLNKIIGQLKAGQQPGSYVVNLALENIPDPPELPNVGAPASVGAASFKPPVTSLEDAFSSVGASATASGFSNSKFNMSFESNTATASSAFPGSLAAQRQPDPFGTATNDPFGGDPFGFGSFDSKQPDPFGFGDTTGLGSDPFGTPTHSRSPAPPRPAKGPAGAGVPPRPAKPPVAVPPPVVSASVSSGWPDDPFAAFGSQSADSSGQTKPATSNAAAFDAFADFASFGDSNAPWS